MSRSAKHDAGLSVLSIAGYLGPRGIAVKEIKDLLPHGDSQQSIGYEKPQKPDRETDYRNRVMDTLWLRLSEAYGYQLISQYGETMPDSWERLLTGITPEMIKQGLERLATREDKWPPNAVEFRQLCLPDKALTRVDPTNDPDHPMYIDRDKQRARIAQPGYLERKKKAGNDTLKAMKDSLI
jgi:hypothetical protein